MADLDIQNAIALLEQGSPDEAIPLLQRLIDVMPIYTTAYVLLARAYEAEQRWHEALSAWQRAHFLMPNSPSVADGVARVSGKASAAAPVREQPSFVDEDEDGDEDEPADSASSAAEVAAQPREGPVKPDTESDELDRLIAELETARIVPRPDVDELDGPELEDDGEEVVSETLARIYESQDQFADAARIYEALATEEPDRAEEFRWRAELMREKLSGGE